MTALSLKKVARLNDPKVTILPTAAPRQVEQRWNAETRAERGRLRKEAPDFFERHERPGMREARKRAEAMQQVKHTPELIVLLMILDSMPRKTRPAMIEKLAPAAVAGGNARLAVEVIRSTTLDVCEHIDLRKALDELNGEAR